MTFLLSLLSLLAVVTTAAAEPTRATEGLDPITIQVDGGPLAAIATSDPSLTPAYSPSTTDYILRCRSGGEPIELTLTAVPGATLRVGSHSGSEVRITVYLVENQALVVDAPDPSGTGRISYWIRCLPADFPVIQVRTFRDPPPGWYLTGNVAANGGAGTYAMILDRNATPVWYQKTADQGALDVTPLARNVLAWSSVPGPGFGADPNRAFSVFDLATGTTAQLKAVDPPLDFHELLPLPNGNRLMLTTPLRAGMNLSALGLGKDQTIVDCVVEEVSGAGQLVWRWRLSDHVSVAESLHPAPSGVDRQKVYDLYHCNSLDQDTATGDLLISLRQTDAIYRIAKTNGSILWKLGGNGVVADGEQHLAIKNDPETTFHGAHDARFQPGGDVSLYDNHSWFLGAARAVQYHIDTRAATARLVWQRQSPDGRHSIATGSFRRYANGTDNLIGWGIKPQTLFTEVDAAGSILLDVVFSDGNAAYRVVKSPVSEFDIDLLRRTAGRNAASFPPAPRVLAAGPAVGRTVGGTMVRLAGKGFSGATAVMFGSTKASSFSVDRDSSITAVAPPGSGTVAVTVTTPGGTSGARPQNMLVQSDATFSTGIGSWRPDVNAALELSNAAVRSRGYSLLVKPRKAGSFSALTSDYALSAGARVTGSIWTRTQRGSDHLRAALVFYDEGGSELAVAHGRFRRVSGRWTEITIASASPRATASVALAVEGIGNGGTLYLDDADLRGSARFVYRRLPPAITSMSSNRGSAGGGTVVSISGEGFSGATAVVFGSRNAASFTVNSDTSITATSPPGRGTVGVKVTTPAGTSSAAIPNLLSAADSTFEGGMGRWITNVNASVSAVKRPSNGGKHSLRVAPLESGFDSAIAGPYPVTGGTEYRLRAFVTAPRRIQHVDLFMTFYGPRGQLLVLEQSPAFVPVSKSGWTRLTLRTLGPEGAASVVVGVDNADGEVPIYIDDVSLDGFVGFTYE
jgi:hypothetical protein